MTSFPGFTIEGLERLPAWTARRCATGRTPGHTIRPSSWTSPGATVRSCSPPWRHLPHGRRGGRGVGGRMPPDLRGQHRGGAGAARAPTGTGAGHPGGGGIRECLSDPSMPVYPAGRPSDRQHRVRRPEHRRDGPRRDGAGAAQPGAHGLRGHGGRARLLVPEPRDLAMRCAINPPAGCRLSTPPAAATSFTACTPRPSCAVKACRATSPWRRRRRV